MENKFDTCKIKLIPDNEIKLFYKLFDDEGKRRKAELKKQR